MTEMMASIPLQRTVEVHMPATDFLAPRNCFLSPLPEHALAADLLSSAADALLAGDLECAGALTRQADMPVLFAFGRRLMGSEDQEIHRRRPVLTAGARSGKVAQRMPTQAETLALHERDGWRCRFCSCRVVSPRARKAMRLCLPGSVPWSETEGFHGGFFALTASVDHVLPHSAGGGNEPANLITACWPCQFGRGDWTIEEVGLIDPASRPPIVDGWDGLTRVSKGTAPAVIAEASLSASTQDVAGVTEQLAALGSGATHRVFSSDQARWLTTLDGIQAPPSKRTLDFLDSCADIDVSWSLNKVLLARMRVRNDTVEFLAIEPNGDVNIPWSLGGHKDAYKGFAEILSNAIPGAICYETPKTWSVSKPGKTRLSLVELLDALPALRSALEALHSALAGHAT